ncbi:MAG: SH3 domain-containing C40 family peptidase [Clostridiales bacterium]|nr:C40 family peptidase [Eubacteriales bacterium]MDH7567707.1 SH3 domain-containing C40 family peptidase [Clostridiales bacterium]
MDAADPPNGTLSSTPSEPADAMQITYTNSLSYSSNPGYSSLPSRGTNDPVLASDPDTLTGVITDKSINLRNYPSTTASDVIRSLKEGEKVRVVSRWENWYKVQTSGKTIGWVRNDLIRIDGANAPENSAAPSTPKPIPLEKPKEVVPRGQQVVNYARKFLGVRYVWGGTSPRGFDCSGFVQYVYRQFGVRLNRVAADQATQGIKVSRNNLKPGDMVFFDTDGGRNNISHVGIYVGGGKFIEASSGYSTHKVIITDMSSGYYSRKFITARRVLSN